MHFFWLRPQEPSPCLLVPNQLNRGLWAHLWCLLASQHQRPICQWKTGRWTGSTGTKGHRIRGCHYTLVVPPRETLTGTGVSQSLPSQPPLQICTKPGFPWGGQGTRTAGSHRDVSSAPQNDGGDMCCGWKARSGLSANLHPLIHL